MKVHIVIAEGGDNSGSLLDRKGLQIEAVYADAGEARRHSTMGDMEAEEHEVLPEGSMPPPAASG